MKVYKRVKFPFELTRGKAEDLYRLRFLRRSELDPPLRHSLRYNHSQMGRQLDLWHKDRAITIGSLNKEHEKLCQNQLRLKREIRRIKKEEYIRNQNEIREKLESIRFRMIMMKVLRKFRENAERKKLERQKAVGKKVDVANYVLSVPTQTDYPEHTEEFKRPIKDTKLSRAKTKTEVIKRDTAIRSYQIGKNRTSETLTYSPPEKQVHATSDRRDVINDVGLDDDDDDVPLSLLGRYPSSKGPRMETIQEEMEIEIEENTDRILPREVESKRQISRSRSNRDVFAINDTVPLLPEVKQTVTSRLTGNKEERGTQTSPPSKTRRKKRSTDDGHKTDKTLIKKTLVVKLPSPIVSPTSVRTTKSSSSTFGQHGSDTEDGYPDSFSDTDEGFFFNSDTVEPSGEYSTELFESLSSDGSIDNGDESGLKFTFDNYRQTLQRKQENSSFLSYPNHPENVNISDFPLRAVFPKQNPFSLRFKERSFYLQSSVDEGRVASARSDRRHVSEHKKETEILEEIRDRRLADIRAKMTQDTSQTTYTKPSGMAVFGKKADCRKINVAPPNTPHVVNKTGLNNRTKSQHKSSFKTESKKENSETSIKVTERQKSYEPVQKEPTYPLERPKPVQLSPFSSPRGYTQDLSAMKSLYTRDKLLKAERDRIFNQTMKMHRFINTFQHLQECTYADIPPRPLNTLNGADTKSSPGAKKTFSGFMFTVNTKGADGNKKIAPPTSVSPQRMLKDCRYLREYISVSDKDYTAKFTERRTSWQRKSENSSSYDNYVANVRLQL